MGSMEISVSSCLASFFLKNLICEERPIGTFKTKRGSWTTPNIKPAVKPSPHSYHRIFSSDADSRFSWPTAWRSGTTCGDRKRTWRWERWASPSDDPSRSQTATTATTRRTRRTTDTWRPLMQAVLVGRAAARSCHRVRCQYCSRCSLCLPWWDYTKSAIESILSRVACGRCLCRGFFKVWKLLTRLRCTSSSVLVRGPLTLSPSPHFFMKHRLVQWRRIWFLGEGQNYHRGGGKLSILTEKWNKNIEQCIHLRISSLKVPIPTLSAAGASLCVFYHTKPVKSVNSPFKKTQL